MSNTVLLKNSQCNSVISMLRHDSSIKIKIEGAGSTLGGDNFYYLKRNKTIFLQFSGDGKLTRPV
jgi:hypothetical protein